MSFFGSWQFWAGVGSTLAALTGAVVIGSGANQVPAAQPISRFVCTVTGVHDGDGPIYCSESDAAGKPIKIRLDGIAARELDGTCSPGQPCPNASAQAAKAELMRLTTGKVLQCQKTGMSYARTVAICSADGEDVACSMVRSGTVLRWARHDAEGRLSGCTR